MGTEFPANALFKVKVRFCSHLGQVCHVLPHFNFTELFSTHATDFTKIQRQKLIKNENG